MGLLKLGDSEASRRQQPAENRKLAVRVLPLFYSDFDRSSGLVVLDPAQPARDAHQHSTLQLTRKASKYQKTSFKKLEGGLGAALNFYFKNAS